MFFSEKESKEIILFLEKVLKLKKIQLISDSEIKNLTEYNLQNYSFRNGMEINCVGQEDDENFLYLEKEIFLSLKEYDFAEDLILIMNHISFDEDGDMSDSYVFLERNKEGGYIFTCLNSLELLKNNDHFTFSLVNLSETMDYDIDNFKYLNPSECKNEIDGSATDRGIIELIQKKNLSLMNIVKNLYV